MWPFNKRFPPKSELVLEPRWSLDQGVYAGRPLLVRLNRGIDAAIGHPDYSHQVGVAIPLRAPDENGFPAREEGEQLGRIEDLLSERLEAERQCIHVATLSTGGMRELVFYSSDPASTHALLEQLATEVSTHEVQHIVQPDPRWKVYRQLA